MEEQEEHLAVVEVDRTEHSSVKSNDCSGIAAAAERRWPQLPWELSLQKWQRKKRLRWSSSHWALTVVELMEEAEESVLVVVTGPAKMQPIDLKSLKKMTMRRRRRTN